MLKKNGLFTEEIVPVKVVLKDNDGNEKEVIVKVSLIPYLALKNEELFLIIYFGSLSMINLVPRTLPVRRAAIRPTFLPGDLNLDTVDGLPMC